MTSEPEQSKPRPCPLCGGLERSVLSRRDVWEIVQRARCGMVFIGTELTYAMQVEDHDWFDDFSKEVNRCEKKHPARMYISRLTRHLRPRTNDRLLAQTVRWCRSGKLVDFGCGDGSFMERATERFDVTGIELSPVLSQLARQRVPAERILVGPLTEIAARRLPAEAFDIVTQFGYIEHEWNPIAGLQAAFRALKPGGVTVLKTPNFASWNRRVMGMEWCGYHVPAHCNYFTPKTLAEMLKKVGFQRLKRPLLDHLPTSDSLWLAARKPA